MNRNVKDLAAAVGLKVKAEDGSFVLYCGGEILCHNTSISELLESIEVYKGGHANYTAAVLDYNASGAWPSIA
mgnify:CR=1 FL=1